MRRWTLAKRLAGAGQASDCVLDCDLVIVPVHLGAHWVCAAVSFRDQEIVYLDSMKVRREGGCACVWWWGWGVGGGC